ncbi:aldehyde dehydrogenase family protein [Chachezhania sediminis]|uniref:aldehyde dehydrogenase family protein n=1 Tax=Chachezhania sediminis TaxID=2599291 RepID=UPI00131DD383|nr:aldehyde dehydrogenase family protein [Chachezhania sediminis]
MNMVPDLDKDLMALQSARHLLANARHAATAFAAFDEATAKEIGRTIAERMSLRAEHYAKAELREGGFGNLADKLTKFRLTTLPLYEELKDLKLGGARRVAADKVVEICRPAGVIVGLSNSTSPVTTVIFKAICAMMTRNAIVFSPHPALLDCTVEAAREIAAIAEAAGAPKHAIQVLDTPTMQAVDAMMKSPLTDLILATGGGPMVRAAYSSGNPALGVGPGNAPVYVDASADLDRAAEMILEGKDFDHGTPCSAPSVILADRPVAAKLRELLQARGGHVFCEDGTRALRDHAFPGGKLNVAIVGKSSETIASSAGLSVAQNCRALICPLANPDRTEPLLKEKLSPVLGFTEVDGIDGAIDVAREMLTLAGAGHTCGIYTADPGQAVQFGVMLDYNRIVVNENVTTGAIGFNTGLPTTTTIGTGFAGRSSVDHNVGPLDLINWKRVAFPLELRDLDAVAPPPATGAVPETWKNELRALLREELARTV